MTPLESMSALLGAWLAYRTAVYFKREQHGWGGAYAALAGYHLAYAWLGLGAGL
jgi:hypothetical protein